MKPFRTLRIADGDPYKTLVAQHPALIDRARFELTRANSYRGFYVGAAALAVGEDPSVGLFFSGHNTKPRRTSDKVCAERRILGSVRKEGAARGELLKIIGVVVAGTADPEQIADVTPYKTPTLYCCTDCIADMGQSESVSDATLITTVGDNKDIYEVQSYETMRFSYESGSLAPPRPVRYKPQEWHRREAMYDTLVTAEEARGLEARRMSDQAELAAYALAATIIN